MVPIANDSAGPKEDIVLSEMGSSGGGEDEGAEGQGMLGRDGSAGERDSGRQQQIITGYRSACSRLIGTGLEWQQPLGTPLSGTWLGSRCAVCCGRPRTAWRLAMVVEDEPQSLEAPKASSACLRLQNITKQQASFRSCSWFPCLHSRSELLLAYVIVRSCLLSLGSSD